MKRLVLSLVGIGLFVSSVYAKDTFSIAGISFGMKKDMVSKINKIKCKSSCKLEFKDLFIDKIEAIFDNNNEVYKIIIDSDIHWNDDVKSNAQINAFNKIIPIKNESYKVVQSDMYNKYLGSSASFYRFEISKIKLLNKYIKYTTDDYIKTFNKTIK